LAREYPPEQTQILQSSYSSLSKINADVLAERSIEGA
jgi:hypothetical protein